MRAFTRWITLSLSAALIAGCAYRGPAAGGPAQHPPSVGAGAARHKAPPAAAGVPAPVRALVAEAERASKKGDQGRAAAYLERALRIAPRNAAIWYNLAVVRYRDEKYALAESLAMKSADLAGSDADLKRRDWSLVAAARQMKGDMAGAARARSRAKKYRSQEAAEH